LQRASLETLAVVAVNVGNREAELAMALDAISRDFLRLVGGIVEDLNIHFFARVIELRDAIHQPLDHVALVKDGKLYGNLGPLSDRRRRARNVILVFEKIVDERVAMQAVGRKNYEHEEIWDHNREIERVRLILPGERQICQAAPVIRKRRARTKRDRPCKLPNHGPNAS
jgi:hypothetical protein